ncbi:hypothetical protein GCM10010443_04080 [Actinoplanes cyaneus]
MAALLVYIRSYTELVDGHIGRARGLGVCYRVASTPRPGPAVLAPAHARADRQAPDKHCYRNAASVAREHGLLYAEGIATTRAGGGLWDLPHAWCVTADGDAIDPTRQAGTGLAYLGIAFTDTMLWPGDERDSILEDHLHSRELPAGVRCPATSQSRLGGAVPARPGTAA